MAKITTIIRPFDMKQQVIVYENGNKIAVEEPKLDAIADTILNLSEKYSVNDIEILGPGKFAQKYGKEINEKALAKYNENKLNIEYK